MCDSYKADPEKKKASVCDSYTRPIPKSRRRRQLQGRSRKEEGSVRQLQGRSRKEEGLCVRQLYKADPEKPKKATAIQGRSRKAEEGDSYTRPIPKRIKKASVRNSYMYTVHVLRTQWGLQLCMNLIAVARVEHNDCNHILLPYSYSLYEPKSHALMEYNGSLEKAILRDSELLSEVNYAFCISSIASSKGCYKICPCSSK